MAGCHQWNPLTDEGRNNVDVELVDLAGVEERGDQFSAAHHPDVFSRCCAQALRKRFHRLRYEFHAWSLPFRRFPGEHVVGELRVEDPAFAPLPLVIVEGPIVGLASPQDGVNRGVEHAHAVIVCGSAIQPFDIAVWPGDVTVSARRNVDDDFSLRFHCLSSAGSNSSETAACGTNTTHRGVLKQPDKQKPARTPPCASSASLDTHGLHRQLEVPPGDLLIHAGDFTFYSKPPSIVSDFDDWLGSLAAPPQGGRARQP